MWGNLEGETPRFQVKHVVSIDQNRVVRLVSKGACQFQFAMKQRIDLKESPISGVDMIID